MNNSNNLERSPEDRALDRTLGRSDRCCSDLKLDRLMAGELGDEEASSLRTHLDVSAACKARFDEMKAEHATLSALLPARQMMTTTTTTTTNTKQTNRRWVNRMLALAPALAAATLLFVVSRQPEDEGLRSKGAGALSVFVQHQGRVRQALVGEAVMPGDRLRFQVRTKTPAHMAVLSRDGGGNVSVYFPTAQTLPRIDARQGVDLDGAIELDRTLGREDLVAFFCDSAVPLSALVEAVRAAEGGAPAFSGCAVDRLSLEKVSQTR